jgi:1,4-dihydroxy-2-naphthoyl-CoA hydrolase
MSFIYPRIIRFQDTDAAGVVYFANVLAMCHEAYEASLAAAGMNLKEFFSRSAIAIPIVHASIDFWQPMYCGDHCLIQLSPTQLADHKFEIRYQIYHEEHAEQLISQALTVHVCIALPNRTKASLPMDLMRWLQDYPPPVGEV